MPYGKHLNCVICGEAFWVPKMLCVNKATCSPRCRAENLRRRVRRNSLGRIGRPKKGARSMSELREEQAEKVRAGAALFLPDYQAGMSLHRVARKHGVSTETVREWLLKTGAKLRPPTSQRRIIIEKK